MFDASVAEDREAVGAGIDLGTETQVSPKERAERAGHAGAVIGLVGVAGSGRGPLAFSLERRLFDLGCSATVLDPRDRRYSDIPERAWPAVWPIVARRLADAGALVIVSGDMPGIGERLRFSESVGGDHFVEVHVATPAKLSAERARDPFAPLLEEALFEAPESPDVTVSIEGESLDAAVSSVVAHLQGRGILAENEG